MSDHSDMRDEMRPEVQALIDAERAAPPPAAAARANVLARVKATVAAPPVASAPSPAAASGGGAAAGAASLSKLYLTVLAALTVVGGVYWYTSTRGPAERPPEAPAPVAAAAEPVAESEAEPEGRSPAADLASITPSGTVAEPRAEPKSESSSDAGVVAGGAVADVVGRSPDAELAASIKLTETGAKTTVSSDSGVVVGGAVADVVGRSPDADLAASIKLAETLPRSTVNPTPASEAESGSEKRAPVKPRRDLAKERALLDQARVALRAGRTGEVFKVLKKHRRVWPRGYLVEEREAMYVQALARAGRADAARKRAERFKARFPGSLHSQAVDSALSTVPPSDR